MRSIYFPAYRLRSAARAGLKSLSGYEALPLMHDLTIVTRNTHDFEGSRAGLMNPFA